MRDHEDMATDAQAHAHYHHSDMAPGLGIAALAAKEGHELWTTEDFCVD